MARMNVYLPDDLAERAKEAGLNVSGLTQDVVAAELDRRLLRAWLDALPGLAQTVTHDEVLSALDRSRGAS